MLPEERIWAPHLELPSNWKVYTPGPEQQSASGVTSLAKALRVGELAAEFGLNPKTLRYYEEIGLLPAPKRTPAGYRQYGPEDRERLDFILKARAIGLSLEEIGQILGVRQAGGEPCEHVVGLLDRKIAQVDAQLRALAEVRRELEGLRASAAGASGTGRICRIIEHYQPSRTAVTGGR